MKAKVTKEFPGRPDDEPLARTIVEGEIIQGALADVAVDLGFAEALKEGGSDAVPDDGLEDMTVAQLEELASERAVDLGGAKKKAEIIAVLRAGTAD